jgi:hypothetical protein
MSVTTIKSWIANKTLIIKLNKQEQQNIGEEGKQHTILAQYYHSD